MQAPGQRTRRVLLVCNNHQQQEVQREQQAFNGGPSPSRRGSSGRNTKQNQGGGCGLCPTLVLATPISGPALMCTPQSVSREMELPTVLVMPTVRAPLSLQYRRHIRVSAVSPGTQGSTGKHRDGGSVLLLLLPLKVGNAPRPQTQPPRFVLPASQGGGSSHFSPSIPFLNPEHRAVTPRKHKTYLQHLV